ncbi:LOW QUALITY PROTEIN: E3 ubiquitin-protein ligase TRIM38, partial [Galemys pyrenaicus]
HLGNILATVREMEHERHVRNMESSTTGSERTPGSPSAVAVSDPLSTEDTTMFLLKRHVRPTREMEREKPCERHRKLSYLICVDSGQPVCRRCVRSPQHRGHHHASVEEVCLGYQVSERPGFLQRHLLSGSNPRSKIENLHEPVTRLREQKDQFSMTLDPDTAHNNLILSEDRREVTYGDNLFHTSMRFSDLTYVLECEAFTSGRRTLKWMWEKDPSLIWEFVWRIERSQNVGVFLDYEAGCVSFCNMTAGSHIFTLTRASFSDSLQPLFRINHASLFLPPHDFKTYRGTKAQVTCMSSLVLSTSTLPWSFSGSIMASTPIVKRMREEALHSICQELMMEPVGINCGHSFCHECIEDSIEEQQGKSWWKRRSRYTLLCTPCRRESVRLVKQLETIIATLREMECESVCEEHGEQLCLFCEGNGQLIYCGCDQSSQHRGHNHVCSHQRCISGLQGRLLQQAELSDLRKSSRRLWENRRNRKSDKIKLQKKKFQSEIEKLHNLLNEEEEFFLGRLEKEQEQTLKRLQDSEHRSQGQRQALKECILELEQKCQQSPQSLLQSFMEVPLIKSPSPADSRSSAMKVEVPEAMFLEHHTVCNISEIYCYTDFKHFGGQLTKFLCRKAMALANTLKKMKEEATCSICLQLMTAPVSIDCGDSFCRLCIEGIIEKQTRVKSLQENFHCPICWETLPSRRLRPLKQLENLIETVKEMERERLCEEHGEQLHLFCEDDGQLICWCCERSTQHKGHTNVLVSEVFPDYKRKIQDALTKLREQEDLCNVIKKSTYREIYEWKEKIVLQRKKIYSDFKSIVDLLSGEETYVLEKLEMEKWQTLKRLGDREASVEKHSSQLKSHILELQNKCQGSPLDLLKDVKDTLSRSSAMRLEVPEAVSLEIQTDCNISELYCDVRELLKPYQVSVTLDPETAHDNLILSKDGRKVTSGGTKKKYYNSRRFLALPCVLGREGFTSGRHYFEVDVQQGARWELGVCLEDVPRDRNVKLKPESGFWVIRRKTVDDCTTLTDASGSICLLSLSPQIVGVFLDCEAGCVSFYNMPTGSHLYTFPKTTFSKTLRPILWVGYSSSLFLPVA